MLYSYMLTKDGKTFSDAKDELNESLDKSYELYNLLLQLMVDLTDIEELRLDEAKHKFLPTDEDLHPNTRFVDNELVDALRGIDALQNFLNDRKLTWRNDDVFLRLMLDKVRNSEEYKEYMAMPKTDFASDCNVWRQLMKKVLLPDADLLEQVEGMSVYCTDEDLDIMGQFVVKTIRRIEDGVKYPILPKYKDEEDSEFGEELFTKAFQLMDSNNKLIDSLVATDKWDTERLAFMDRLIMCIALAEIESFVKIPVNVSLNEYIEIAKMFSTARSGQFVNGILNSAVKELRQKGELIKK
ncbi:MAG: transcription antitermination factor NusB [Bacteroidales bacterium]|nr:transcription antitermination factor NusB [Bacteroidales bacterium]MDY3912843.1 transcription antitermination factor NusB [Sodaliphilus sp.]